MHDQSKLLFTLATSECKKSVRSLEECVRRGRKMLVYCGLHHAFTRFRQPAYDFETGTFHRHINSRAGNLVHREIPGRTFTIFLHAPWPSRERNGFERRPVEGVIDDVMLDFDETRVGFDVAGSPFGGLRDDESYYALGHEEFTLGMFCDGYVYQKDLEDYEGCTVDPAFITADNLDEAIANVPKLRAMAPKPSVQDVLGFIREDADFAALFADLE